MTARDSEIDCWVGYGSDDSVSVDINYAQLQGTPNCEESGEDDILGCFSPRPTGNQVPVLMDIDHDNVSEHEFLLHRPTQNEFDQGSTDIWVSMYTISTASKAPISTPPTVESLLMAVERDKRAETTKVKLPDAAVYCNPFLVCWVLDLRIHKRSYEYQGHKRSVQSEPRVTRKSYLCLRGRPTPKVSIRDVLPLHHASLRYRLLHTEELGALSHAKAVCGMIPDRPVEIGHGRPATTNMRRQGQPLRRMHDRDTSLDPGVQLKAGPPLARRLTIVYPSPTIGWIRIPIFFFVTEGQVS
ncbi:hypothetical protein J6590_015242 [Homalodisca vitripennis]|nr:hypothetical protein J6590_015242 [Homalodisca vitripennis]